MNRGEKNKKLKATIGLNNNFEVKLIIIYRIKLLYKRKQWIKQTMKIMIVLKQELVLLNTSLCFCFIFLFN